MGRLFRGIASVLFFFELRARGVQCAEFIGLRGLKPRVRNAGTMRFGSDFRAHGRVIRSQFATGPKGTLLFGDHVAINEGASISARHAVTVADHVIMGDYVSIDDTDYHETAPGMPAGAGAISIGRNAWLGRNVIVLRGVTIGANAVIAAGAVVTKDVPANTLAGGVPARVIRELAIPDPENYVRPR